MEYCINHPRNSAIERCEFCGRTLCGLCLWYGDDGRRLCQEHASVQQSNGLRVFPPETYAEALSQGAEAEDEPGLDQQQQIPYQGNNQDLNALLAAVLGITALFSCLGGAYCLPVAATILGLVAYLNASKSVVPARTRKLAALGMGLGGLWLLFFVFVSCLFLGILAISIFMSGSTP